MTSYRISDAAKRTGLPTSTLRYYERIGLLPAPERTDSGYRAYEERTLERLMFIARAKTLGLGLDDIGQLADLWDADRCGPVQARLRDIITAKVAATEARARALTALASELSSFASGLNAPEPDAPCGEGCGCDGGLAVTPPSGRGLQMLPATGADLGCTLDAAAASERVDEWQELARAAENRTTIDGGVRLTFAATDLRAMADLVAREQSCCAFLSFAIAVTPTAATLDITGPAEVRPLIEALA